MNDPCHCKPQTSAASDLRVKKIKNNNVKWTGREKSGASNVSFKTN